MKKKARIRFRSERQVDERVVAQADDMSAWEKPVRVRRGMRASVPLTSALAARAAFFARLHREPSVKGWLVRVIEERMDMEETALAELKRDLRGRNEIT